MAARPAAEMLPDHAGASIAVRRRVRVLAALLLVLAAPDLLLGRPCAAPRRHHNDCYDRLSPSVARSGPRPGPVAQSGIASARSPTAPSMAARPAAISCSRGAVVGIGARALIATARLLDGASAADVALYLRRGIGWLREEPLNISEP